MKRISVLVVALAALVVLAGCTSMGASNQSTQDSGGAASEGSAPQGAPEPFTRDETAGGDEAPDRAVITTGSVSITVADPMKAAQDAVTITDQAGGRVDSRTENPGTPNQPASAKLTLRIPAGEFDRALAELRKLGTVNFVSLSAADVTQQTRDLDARITSLTTSADRLLALMQSSANTTDLIAVETALATRQSELEAMVSQRDFLTDQVEFSAVNLELFSTGVVAPGSPDSFWTGIAAGWNALVAAVGGALIGIGFALPWLVTLGIVVVIVLLIVWLSTRGRKAA